MRLRPEVLAFARLMEAKLREHDDRPGWQEDEPEALFRRLVEEAGELDVALGDWAYTHARDRSTHAEIAVWEAVDVANFAMMIADVLGFPGPKGEA